MQKGILKMFILGGLTVGALTFAALKPSPQDEMRAAHAAAEIVQDSRVVRQALHAGEYKQAELAVLTAATEANKAGDNALRNQFRQTAEAFDLLYSTKAKLDVMAGQKTNFETFMNIEIDTYIASAKRLEQYLKLAQELGWDAELRAEIERGIRPTLVRAIEIADGVAAHGNHQDVARIFAAQASQLLR